MVLTPRCKRGPFEARCSIQPTSHHLKKDVIMQVLKLLFTIVFLGVMIVVWYDYIPIVWNINPWAAIALFTTSLLGTVVGIWD